jgi:ribosome-interacting GTPase 1
MPINVNDPEYVSAEKAYFESDSLEDKLAALRKMISHAPKHKGGENLRQQLTTRRKKLEEQIDKKKKTGKSTQQGIKKGDMQASIIGKTNSGKSSLLKILTNTNPKISEIKFTTNEPLIGIMEYENSQIQLIEIPSIEGDFFDKGIVNTTDTLIILIENVEQIKEIEKQIPLATKKRIIVFNKIDKLTDKEKRKISATLQSKKYNYILVSSIPQIQGNGIEELKKRIFESFDIIRIFTKEPSSDSPSEKPIIMKPNSTVKDAAEKILKGFSKKVKKTKIWGPSSKFSGQIVGLNHKLKDKDVVEFTTR